MMEKIVEVGSWPGFAEQPVQLVKVSRRGLIGADRAAFVKRAGHALADQLDRVKIAADEIPIHVLAIGATEAYGPNRNGDGFAERWCRSNHDTFVKHGRHYEHHKNKDPKKSFGPIKLSAYNEPMRRIELLVIGNASKEAAERNSGLPLEPDVIDKLERGDDVGWSMATKVAFDVCSNCGNKAPSRDKYCTAETCVDPETGRRGFGCKDGLTKLADDGVQQYVDNPDPLFFDISRVWRPADRQAYGWKAGYLEKAAADGRVLGGAELAELYARENGYEITLLSPAASADERLIARQVKLAHALAAIERELQNHGLTERDRAIARAFSPEVQPPVDLRPLGKVGSAEQATGLAALAGQKIALSIRDFLRLVSGEEDGQKLASVSACVVPDVPGIFSRLATDPNLDSFLRNNPFSPARQLAPARQRDWAAKLAAARSLDGRAIRRRVERAAILNSPLPAVAASGVKAAAAGPGLDLARQYALYKLAALFAMPEETPEQQTLTLRAAILQNLSS